MGNLGNRSFDYRSLVLNRREPYANGYADRILEILPSTESEGRSPAKSVCICRTTPHDQRWPGVQLNPPPSHWKFDHAIIVPSAVVTFQSILKILCIYIFWLMLPYCFMNMTSTYLICNFGLYNCEKLSSTSVGYQFSFIGPKVSCHLWKNRKVIVNKH